jgi:hypothetical protein
MRLPGFSAEFGLSGRSHYFCSHAPYGMRSSGHAVTMAAQCCPPGFDTTGCVQQQPPDCTTLGCPRGKFCCDSFDPPVCLLNNAREQCICAGGVFIGGRCVFE